MWESRKYRMKKRAKKAIANGCHSSLAVWAESGLKPEGCRPYSLDGRITLGSCMTAEFSSHNHTEPPLASQICHQTTLDVALSIEKFCCHQRSVRGDRNDGVRVHVCWKRLKICAGFTHPQTCLEVHLSLCTQKRGLEEQREGEGKS